jgi:hypothetical protein
MRAAARALAVLAAALALALAARPAAAAEEPTQRGCARRCEGAVAACAAALAAGAPDAAAIAAAKRSFDCARAPRLPACRDFALLALDAFQYAARSAGAGAGGDDAGVPRPPAPCAALARVCEAFCLNDRAPARPLGAAGAAVDFVRSPAPVDGTADTLLAEFVLATRDPAARALRGAAAAVVLTERPPRTRLCPLPPLGRGLLRARGAQQRDRRGRPALRGVLREAERGTGRYQYTQLLLHARLPEGHEHQRLRRADDAGHLLRGRARRAARDAVRAGPAGAARPVRGAVRAAAGRRRRRRRRRQAGGAPG